MIKKFRHKLGAFCHFALKFDHVAVTLIAYATLYVIIGIAFNVSFLNPLARAFDNFRMTDIFYEISNAGGERDTSDMITIVDMTNIYDRYKLAETIDQIQDCKPAVMGIDIVFDGIRNDSAGNERLIEAVCNTSSPTVWAYKLTNWNSDEAQFEQSYHSFFVDLVDVEHEGFINVQRDTNGGTVRSLGIHRQAEGEKEYSMSAQIALAATNDSSIVTHSKDCNINYTATYFPVVPSDSIEEYSDLIRSHVVLFGAMHDLRDQHYTPIGKIPGVEILAYTVQTLIDRRMPIEPPVWVTMLINFLLVVLVQIIQQGVTNLLVNTKSATKQYIGRSGLAKSYIAMFAMVVMIGTSFLFTYQWNIYLNTAWAIMGIALLYNAREFYGLLIRLLCERWPVLKQSMYYIPLDDKQQMPVQSHVSLDSATIITGNSNFSSH